MRSGNVEEMRKVAVPMLQEGDMDYLVLTDAKGRTLFRAHLPNEIPSSLRITPQPMPVLNVRRMMFLY